MDFDEYFKEKRNKPYYYIQHINGLPEVKLYEGTNNAGILYEYKYLLRHLENDLKEEKEDEV